jgi:MoxR-like ATPase
MPLGVTDHVATGDLDADDASTDQNRLDATTDGFDFGEFRHAGNRPGPGERATILGSAPVSAGRAAFRSRVATACVATPKTGTTMTDSMLHQEDPVAAAAAVRTVAERIRAEVGKVIVGQEEVLEEVLLAIFCGGHAIIEGVPGLAKTLLVHSLASTLGLQFSRIQFTPDLMPTDMTGTEVIEEDRTTGRRELRFVPGPIFANVILADEINRTPPKTQGALLEAMQERQVTVGGKTHVLPSPFFVLATQNPIEQEGTYPLPEAQLDRFMFNIRIGYPTEADELAIVQRTTTIGDATPQPVLDAADCLRIQQLVRQVPVADHVARYALRLVRATRVRESRDDKPEIVRDYLAWGAGPRASQFLVLAAKAMALVTGSTHVTPELIRAVALPVMRHRIIANFNAEADGVTTDDVVRGLLDTIPVDQSDPATRSTLDSVTR